MNPVASDSVAQGNQETRAAASEGRSGAQERGAHQQQRARDEERADVSVHGFTERRLSRAGIGIFNAIFAQSPEGVLDFV